jgi:hypothetical protein
MTAHAGIHFGFSAARHWIPACAHCCPVRTWAARANSQVAWLCDMSSTDRLETRCLPALAASSFRRKPGSIVVGAETFPIQQYGKYKKWIPACAGMTEKCCEVRMQDL